MRLIIASLMIILIIYQRGVLPLEREGQPPILIYPHSPMTSELTFKSVQPPVW